MDIARFYAFVNERWAIRERRLAGQSWPWTTDPILQKYRFTNVKREHDRTSARLIENLYHPNRLRPLSEALFNAAIYRYFGKAEFALAVGWQPSGTQAIEYVENLATARLRLGQPVYTGAYIVTNAGRPGPKAEVICRHFLTDLLRKLDETSEHILVHSTMKEAIKALTRVDGFASFMAKEVLLDTLYTDAWQATDRETWTPMGPGARRGASQIKFGDGRKLSETEALGVCREMYSQRYLYWEDTQNRPLLLLEDIQFQMCEFYKYEKVRLGLGRPRGRYTP